MKLTSPEERNLWNKASAFNSSETLLIRYSDDIGPKWKHVSDIVNFIICYLN